MGTPNPWNTSQQRSNAPPGWRTYDAHEKGRLPRNKSWLASFVSGSNSPLPVHGTGDKHPWETMDSLHGPAVRLRNMKRQLLRRLSSWSGGDTHTRHGSGSLTRQPPPSPLSAASASTLRFALLCALWYTTSALSSNTGKAILTQFRFPITLTFVQFGFVAGYCLLFMSPAVRFARFKTPTRAVFSSTLPMGCFQVGGHIFSSMAISRIPVSTVHTIKVSTASVRLCVASPGRASSRIRAGPVAIINLASRLLITRAARCRVAKEASYVHESQT